MFNNKFPPKGANPEIVRMIARVNEHVDPLLGDDLSPTMSPRARELIMKVRRAVAKQERIVGEMQATVLEMEQATDQGYVEGLLPANRAMAQTADEYHRELRSFDRRVATDEAQWAREDATEANKQRPR